ncbi:hypothetical protein L6R52_02160 [Myxococcota bacterium]|nr:hypothetical protein [Myxococcota bacterium]
MSIAAKLARSLVVLSAPLLVLVAHEARAADPTTGTPVPAEVKPTTPAPLEEVEVCVAYAGMPDGFVTLEVKPTVEVYAGDKLLGETPLAKARVPSGKADLRLVDPKTKTERRICVDVEPNKVMIYKLDLSRLPSDKRVRVGPKRG